MYPLVNMYKELWKDPPFYSWENSRTFDWATLNSYVELPESSSETLGGTNPAAVDRWFYPTIYSLFNHPVEGAGFLPSTV